jgi:hypothetical protein
VLDNDIGGPDIDFASGVRCDKIVQAAFLHGPDGIQFPLTIGNRDRSRPRVIHNDCVDQRSEASLHPPRISRVHILEMADQQFSLEDVPNRQKVSMKVPARLIESPRSLFCLGKGAFQPFKPALQVVTLIIEYFACSVELLGRTETRSQGRLQPQGHGVELPPSIGPGSKRPFLFLRLFLPVSKFTRSRLRSACLLRQTADVAIDQLKRLAHLVRLR